MKGKAAADDEAASESDNTESKSVAESVEETVNFKKKRSVESNKSNENLSDYLEDYFDVIASCQGILIEEESSFFFLIFIILFSRWWWSIYCKYISSIAFIQRLSRLL